MDIPERPAEFSNISSKINLIQAAENFLSFSPENQLVATASCRLPIDESMGALSTALNCSHADELLSTS